MKALLILLPFFAFSQNGNVGINTTSPTATIDVNGTARVRNLPTVVDETYIIVSNEEGDLKKMKLSDIQKNTCPNFNEEKSNCYYLLFYSEGSITKPNDMIQINNLPFKSAGTWIENNWYYFSYTNVNGKPLDITKSFEVNFNGIKCNYKN